MCGRVKMGCIMTPMPNHLSTCLSLFYYSSFDEWGRVENTLQNNQNHTKQCEKEEWSGAGKIEVWEW